MCTITLLFSRHIWDGDQHKKEQSYGAPLEMSKGRELVELRTAGGGAVI